MAISIKNWNTLFEVAQSKKVKGELHWVAVPTKHDGKSFRRIMRAERGIEVYAAWILILQVAAKCPVRGVLADDCGPLTTEDLELKTGCQRDTFDYAIKLLCSKEIGWLEELRDTTAVVHATTTGYDATPTRHNRTVQDSTRQDNTCGETEIPSSPPVPKGEPAVLEFPCDGTPNAWRLTPSQLDEWRTLFPSLDLLAECRSALAWVLASANRRKTARGMPKFLVGWFGRAQNANGRRYGSGGTESVPPRGAVPPSPQKIAEDRFYRAQVVIDRGRRQKKSDAEIESDLVAAGFDPREAYAAAPMTHEPKPTR